MQGVQRSETSVLRFEMRWRHQGFRDRHELGNLRKKHLIKISLILMVQIACFGESLQAHKITGQEDALWVIENVPGAVKQGVSACGGGDQDACMDISSTPTQETSAGLAR
jgi:hypothetical protein